MKQLKPKDIDEYISGFPTDIQEILLELRYIIKKAAPQSTEVISYNMPAFKQNKVLVFFAATQKHIGFYPTASPLIKYKNELTKFKTSKGTIQFAQNKKLPKNLITKIVKFRVEETAGR